MNKKDLKVVVVDDSEFACMAIEKMIIKTGFDAVKYFTSPLDFIEYYKNRSSEIDILFVDYSMPEIDGLKVLSYLNKNAKVPITVMMTGILDVKLKQTAIELGVNEFMNKNIDYPEFRAKLNVLANLRLLQYSEAEKNAELKVVLKYRDQQENLAVQKQLKIIQDNLSFHSHGNLYISTYFNPKEILSGDSYSNIAISEDEFLFVIADGMGKGVSASFSSVLTVSFINYATKRSLEFNDFNFSRLVKDTFNYVKSIMLFNEAMSMLIFKYNKKDNKLTYVNFGLPPIYYISLENNMEKIKPNNRPLLGSTKEYQIDELEIHFKTLLATTDGLTESLMHNERPYIIEFKKSFQNALFLNDITKDFYKKVKEADDDMTIVFLRYEFDENKKVMEEKLLLREENLEEYVEEFENCLNIDVSQMVKDKLVFVLNELLLNSYEHSLLKLKNKHNVIKYGKKIEYKGEDKYVNISLFENNDYIVLVIEDEGDGFNVNEIIKQELFNKYHGRGLKMINKLANGLFYNKKGNHLKVYLKK